ncbi:hypothetical protein HYT84_01360, partial [Candidatus Micrarchaeota archaeon]|nr:hypothetical protein [Candidatus Micrarchaeota archaeon]
FVTLLGDSFIEPSSELKKIIEFHKKQKPIATILLFKVTDSTQYGVVKSIKSEFEGFDLISDVVEKPDKETAKRFENKDGFYAICGAYVFEPKIFSYLRSLKNGKELTDAIKAAINKGEKVYGRILDGKYLDMGKWKTVLATEKYMMENSNIEQRIKERETLMNKIRERSEK